MNGTSKANRMDLDKKRAFNQIKKEEYKIGAQVVIISILILGFFVYMVTSTTENYSNGERIGYLTKLSSKGRYWKTWEGELNLTQTGMNTSSRFPFSIDRNNRTNSNEILNDLKKALDSGQKIKITYHQTFFKNWFSNRGETNYFITSVSCNFKKNNEVESIDNINNSKYREGRVIDTIYVVIDKNELKNRK